MNRTQSMRVKRSRGLTIGGHNIVVRTTAPISLDVCSGSTRWFELVRRGGATVPLIGVSHIRATAMDRPATVEVEYLPKET
jgi:hypothetical protein